MPAPSLDPASHLLQLEVCGGCVCVAFGGWQGLELSAGVPRALDAEQGGDNPALCRYSGWAVTMVVTSVYLQQEDAMGVVQATFCMHGL